MQTYAIAIHCRIIKGRMGKLGLYILSQYMAIYV